MIVLASQSPRRSQLLSLITADFRVQPACVDEHTDLQDDPRAMVYELARRKAQAVAADFPDDIVIGADTVVYVDSEVLGKPKDKDDVKRMMRTLRAKPHQVWTGVCMIWDGEEQNEQSGSIVDFTDISDREIDEYADTEDVMDKAGAYAIQEGAAKFVERIDGSYTGIMGLPVEIVYHMLKKTGREF